MKLAATPFLLGRQGVIEAVSPLGSRSKLGMPSWRAPSLLGRPSGSREAINRRSISSPPQKSVARSHKVH